MAAAVQYSAAGVSFCYYIAKLVRTEKEPSDWLAV